MNHNPFGLNTEKPSIMWIDLNSAFATAEQQAHPSLRNRPIGVTNRLSKECCVIAASYEAKALGIKVGCRRTEALGCGKQAYQRVRDEVMRLAGDLIAGFRLDLAEAVDERYSADFRHRWEQSTGKAWR